MWKSCCETVKNKSIQFFHYQKFQHSTTKQHIPRNHYLQNKDMFGYSLFLVDIFFIFCVVGNLGTLMFC